MSEVANYFAVNDADSGGYYMCVETGWDAKLGLPINFGLCKHLDSASFPKQFVFCVSDVASCQNSSNSSNFAQRA